MALKTETKGERVGGRCIVFATSVYSYSDEIQRKQTIG